MAGIKLDYVNSFTDTRGKRRHCSGLRRIGPSKKVTIKGRPLGSEEFMEHCYHALVAQTRWCVVGRRGWRIAHYGPGPSMRWLSDMLRTIALRDWRKRHGTCAVRSSTTSATS